MRLCLAFMMQNDVPWLRLHLPVYAASDVFDGIVALDGGSTDDSVEYVESLGGRVYAHPFANHFGAQGNRLINACALEGYDAMLRIDPDELLSVEDMHKVRGALEAFPDRLLGLTRRHFVGDRLHVHPDWYPDYQWRAWWLNSGTRYDDAAAVHELPTGNRLELPDVTLFHYGYTLSDGERAYKIALYEAIQQGAPLPTRADYANWKLNIPRVEYTGPQPLDPAVIGDRAPFGEA